MKKLDAIKQRLEQVTDAGTNTDAKLESGAIMDWVNYADEDMAWLIARLDELAERGEQLLKVLRDYGAWEGAAAYQALYAAIEAAVNTEESEDK